VLEQRFIHLLNVVVSPGQWIIISGCGGGLGHLGIQFAKALGYKVVGIDTRREALQVAESLGVCDVLIDASKNDDPSDLIKKVNGGKGAHAAIILPDVQVAFDFSIQLLGIHGIMCVVSFPAGGFRFSCDDVVFRDVRIIGGLIGPPEEMREMLTLFSRHNVKLIKKEYSFDEINELVKDYNSGTAVGKLVVVM
jgi:D-arabinose 1-dehydrogenase-like Zn-dependent alcohol dehydrogenase